MADANSNTQHLSDTDTGYSSLRYIQHPVFQGRSIRLPSPSKLKWLGGNMGFDMPISEDVIDDQGSWLGIGLKEVLSRLNDFEGYRGNVTVAENILERAFSAYEFGLMTAEERVTFENFVAEKAKVLNPFELIKKGLLSEIQSVKHKLLGA
ncbi:hypothetical protein [Methylophilus sp. OH31]|uniref:hypothetical protein n=1 Tax=Methylophilus sp. OH31 TaxID=1387312 RepID=UPI00046444A9|nr:hypothetical protein [Methylophilus sp. OH31]